VALAVGKLYAMHRMVQIPFGALSLAGVAVLVWMNYFGPMWMSRLMVGDAAEEAVRRGRWFLIQMGLSVGAGLVLWEAARAAVESSPEQGPKRVFLQSPIMVYVFALVFFEIDDHHVGALFGEGHRDRPADPAVPAGDNRDLVFQLIGAPIVPRLRFRLGLHLRFPAGLNLL